MVLSSGDARPPIFLLPPFLLFYPFTFLLLKVLFTFLPLSTVSFVAFDGKAGAEWVCAENQSFVLAKSICHLRVSTKKSEICKKNTTVKGWEIKRKPYLCAEVRVLQKEDTIKVETQIHSRSVKMPAIHELDSSNVRIILKLTYIIKIMDNVIVKLAHSSCVMTTSSYIK